MKLKKAKEILELNVKEAGKQMPPDTLLALRLGTEALDRVLSDRYSSSNPVYVPLRGETPEGESP